MPHIVVAPRGLPGTVLDDALKAHGLSRRVVRTTGTFVTAPFLVAGSDSLLTISQCDIITLHI